MQEMLLVCTTTPDHETANRLARLLVESSAAVCVNLLAPCQSIYRWQGQIEVVEEIPLQIKTTVAAYPHVEQLLRAHHPYEVPEIIALPVQNGLPQYLRWVENNVQQDSTVA